MTTYYKVTLADGSPCHGGKGKWGLPHGKRPGAWRSVEGEIEPCRNGLHLCEPTDLSQWLKIGASVWEAQAKGEAVRDSNKTAVRTARLLRLVGTVDHKLLVEFACACAERVLPIFEAKYPKDDRPRKAIDVARKVAAGELPAAADAAYTDAAYAAYTDAANAAYAAADAARDEERDEERAWQAAKLLELLASHG